MALVWIVDHLQKISNKKLLIEESSKSTEPWVTFAREMEGKANRAAEKPEMKGKGLVEDNDVIIVELIQWWKVKKLSTLLFFSGIWAGKQQIEEWIKIFWVNMDNEGWTDTKQVMVLHLSQVVIARAHKNRNHLETFGPRAGDLFWAL